MTQRNKYLRFAAIIPALVLAGAFVAYRAGAFSKTEPPPQPPASPAATEKSPAFFGGSKSAEMITTAEDPRVPPEKPPVFFGGSKSPALPGITHGLTPAGSYTPNLDDVPVRPQPAPAPIPPQAIPTEPPAPPLPPQPPANPLPPLELTRPAPNAPQP